MDRRRVLLGSVGLVGGVGCASSGTPSSAAPEGKTSANPAPSAATGYGAGLFPATFRARAVGAPAAQGSWTVDRVVAVRGETLPTPTSLDIVLEVAADPAALWSLSGVAGHARYVERAEKTPLDAASPKLGRPEASRGALIPIRKSAAWWSLPQDERRAIFEGRSKHIEFSMPYLPRIARRLYQARDLGQPFDFLTWVRVRAGA